MSVGSSILCGTMLRSKAEHKTQCKAACRYRWMPWSKDPVLSSVVQASDTMQPVIRGSLTSQVKACHTTMVSTSSHHSSLTVMLLYTFSFSASFGASAISCRPWITGWKLQNINSCNRNRTYVSSVTLK